MASTFDRRGPGTEIQGVSVKEDGFLVKALLASIGFCFDAGIKKILTRVWHFESQRPVRRSLDRFFGLDGWGSLTLTNSELAGTFNTARDGLETKFSQSGGIKKIIYTPFHRVRERIGIIRDKFLRFLSKLRMLIHIRSN